LQNLIIKSTRRFINNGYCISTLALTGLFDSYSYFPSLVHLFSSDFEIYLPAIPILYQLISYCTTLVLYWHADVYGKSQQNSHTAAVVDVVVVVVPYCCLVKTKIEPTCKWTRSGSISDDIIEEEKLTHPITDDGYKFEGFFLLLLFHMHQKPHIPYLKCPVPSQCNLCVWDFTGGAQYCLLLLLLLLLLFHNYCCMHMCQWIQKWYISIIGTTFTFCRILHLVHNKYFSQSNSCLLLFFHNIIDSSC
jgi:hypothetical protein